ncbi:hypothetical protein ACTHR6_20465 [Ralstonia holmesii]|uniref:Uncharacterized protein n=1 Tax=Ralstonia holmesii TaxID=3058602 RepID=A0ABC8QIP9_9RALS|nr:MULTISPECIES: hypothetical protein [Ralstonia]CAJ0699662.1 hypothetical protein R11007_03098 [Ralstonia sp. LMG 32967]CAJ0805987.1 hypothetical protein LMG18096_04716 [Ralstonia sp. LMG 32967]CAJ0811367.1 hypothetical protein LMG18093_01331 [Ralstonia sp. LMG 32967]
MTATQQDKRFSGFGDGIGGFEGAADAEFSGRREHAIQNATPAGGSSNQGATRKE